MNEDICKAIIGFMGRATLRGDEVPAFNECVEAIRAEFEKAQVSQPSSAGDAVVGA